MRFLSKIGVLVILGACTAWAGQIAVLNNGFTIRHDHHAVLNQITRLYLSSGNESYIDVPTAEIVRFDRDNAPVHPMVAPASAKQDVSAAVSEASTRHQIDSDFINSVIHAESGFNPHAVSPKGAQGLMQLMPGTASRLGVENPFDPAANVDGGTQYLRELLDYYHGDMVKTLAAYNAGPQRVAKYHGVPPYRETHAYVARIVREFNRKKLAEKKAQTAAKKPVTRKSNRQAVSNPARESGRPVPKQAGTGS